MKICCKCKIEKNESDFNKNKSRKDGLHAECKECSKIYKNQWDQVNKENKKIYKKKWDLEHKQHSFIYRLINHERILKVHREYNNSIEGKKVLKLYRDNNKAKIIKRQSIYLKNKYTKDINFKNILGLRRYITYAIKPDILKRDNYKCTLCNNTDKLIIHHIIPVQYIKNKYNITNSQNLITLCTECHLKKHIMVILKK